MTSAKLSYKTYLVTSNNSNKIYKYVTSLSKQFSIPSSMHYGSKLSQSPSETVQLFNDYFYSVYNKNASYSLSDTGETNRTLGHINISINDVWTSLIYCTSMDPTVVKPLGLIISIPRFLSTVIATSLSEPIHHLFCLSITHGQLRTFRVENLSYHTNFQNW